MMAWIIDWCKSLTMEEMFVLTGICALLTGTGLGFLVAWAFRGKKGDAGSELSSQGD